MLLPPSVWRTRWPGTCMWANEASQARSKDCALQRNLPEPLSLRRSSISINSNRRGKETEVEEAIHPSDTFFTLPLKMLGCGEVDSRLVCHVGRLSSGVKAPNQRPQLQASSRPPGPEPPSFRKSRFVGQTPLATGNRRCQLGATFCETSTFEMPLTRCFVDLHIGLYFLVCIFALLLLLSSCYLSS